MLLNKLSDMRGCLKDNKVCKYCLGQIKIFPTSVCCSLGNECGRGECCFHREEVKKEV